MCSKMSPIQVEIFVCSACGKEFEAACLVEFEEKKKKHKCKPVNKQVARTAELQQQQTEQAVSDVVVNRIEEHNFDNLIRQGVIVAK